MYMRLWLRTAAYTLLYSAMDDEMARLLAVTTWAPLVSQNGCKSAMAPLVEASTMITCGVLGNEGSGRGVLRRTSTGAGQSSLRGRAGRRRVCAWSRCHLAACRCSRKVRMSVFVTPGPSALKNSFNCVFVHAENDLPARAGQGRAGQGTRGGNAARTPEEKC
jgi:hypothetical protein